MSTRDGVSPAVPGRPADGSADLPQRLIRPDILALSAYHVPPADGLLKLDAMENPYPWPGELTEQWLSLLRDEAAHLNRYPSASAEALKARLRDVYQPPDGAELLLGNGSDELIQLAALALARADSCLLAPEPSFVMYRMVATFAGMRFVGVPLRPDDFALDPEAMRTALRRHRPALTFLAYPNNPTGNRFDPDAVAALIEASPGLVIVDEAYCAFAEHSFLPRVLDFPNLLVMRTLSKIGLAGLRLGFLVGRRDWIAQLEKLRLPYNLSTLTQLSAAFALCHHATLQSQAERIKTERARLSRELSALNALQVFPSETNFLLLRLADGRAEAVHRELLEAGILVKCLHRPTADASGDPDPLRECLRVSVGTEAENTHFINKLKAML